MEIFTIGEPRFQEAISTNNFRIDSRSSCQNTDSWIVGEASQVSEFSTLQLYNLNLILILQYEFAQFLLYILPSYDILLVSRLYLPGEKIVSPAPESFLTIDSDYQSGEDGEEGPCRE